MTYSLFNNIANVVKYTFIGLTKIHWHSTQAKHTVCELKEETYE